MENISKLIKLKFQKKLHTPTVKSDNHCIDKDRVSMCLTKLVTKRFYHVMGVGTEITPECTLR